MQPLIRDLCVCAVLAIVAIATHRGVLNCDFVNYDDPTYVSENPRVQQGLTAKNLAWAFTFVYSSWTPIDTISHMADCQAFGMNPRGHHATNLAFHAANAVLLFLLLRSLTAAPWCAFFVAALFAVHPMNAGTVAWISCRKDVLSTFLGLLALASYAHYARKPGAMRYVLVALLLTVSLMAKPMMMTLPVLFLLLDVWPLKRLAASAATVDEDSASETRPTLTLGRLLLEKIPLFAVSAAFSFLTFWTQRASGSIMRTDWYPFPMRVSNAVVSTIMYLVKTVWPFNFTVAYPHAGTGIPLWQIGGSVLLICAITAAAVVTRRSRGYILAGWLWYLVALAPVSGVIAQLGGSSMADRYAYFSMIGVYFAVIWLVSDIAKLHPFGRTVAGGAGLVAMLLLAFLSSREAANWKNSETMWSHALDVTQNNAVAESGYGEALIKLGKRAEAEEHLQKALAIAPQLYLAQNNLGTLLAMKGDIAAAKEKFQEALRLKPDYAKALCNLANCFLHEKNDAEAKRLFTEALKYLPDYDPSRPIVENAVRELSAQQSPSS